MSPRGKGNREGTSTSLTLDRRSTRDAFTFMISLRSHCLSLFRDSDREIEACGLLSSGLKRTGAIQDSKVIVTAGASHNFHLMSDPFLCIAGTR